MTQNTKLWIADSYEVVQDGNRFYLNNDQVFQAPFAVTDYDMEAAEKARDWFLGRFSPGAIKFI